MAFLLSFYYLIITPPLLASDYAFKALVPSLTRGLHIGLAPHLVLSLINKKITECAKHGLGERKQSRVQTSLITKKDEALT